MKENSIFTACKKDMTREQRVKCNLIIHGFAAAAGAVGAGLAQSVCADSLVITPLQVAMIMELGQVFGRKITKSAATATAASVRAREVGKVAVKLLWKQIPGVGNALNATVAAALTERIGWAAAAEFAREAKAPSGSLRRNRLSPTACT